jgi:hypothetical protein
MSRKAWPVVTAALLSCLVVVSCGQNSKVAEDAKELEAFETGKDAYIYAYPLVTMDLTRRTMTNVVAPKGTSSPMGQFARLREYPNASFNAVTVPNADTLYTVAWFDVSKEPWVISIPDLKGRYALFPMLDGWTPFSEIPANAPLALVHSNLPSLDRAGTERFGWCDRVQIADRNGMVLRPHLLHRHA